MRLFLLTFFTAILFVYSHAVAQSPMQGEALNASTQVSTLRAALQTMASHFREELAQMQSFQNKLTACAQKAAVYNAGTDKCVREEFRACVQVIDHPSRGLNNTARNLNQNNNEFVVAGADRNLPSSSGTLGSIACTPWGGGASAFSFDSDRYDPDGVRVLLERRIVEF